MKRLGWIMFVLLFGLSLKLFGLSIKLVGLSLNSWGRELYLPASGEGDFSLLCSPLADHDMSFDFVEQEGGDIQSGRETDDASARLVDTYWRNRKTGDWVVGFADGWVVYDSRLWRVVASESKRGTQEFRLEGKDGETHRLRVGECKKGVRKIMIDEQKAVECEVISGKELGDYPLPDETSAWDKSDIRRVDTAYVCGWLKDLDDVGDLGGAALTFFYNTLFLSAQQNISPRVDSLGYFEMKMPLSTAARFLVGVGNELTIMTVLEPGRHYFMLFDLHTGHTLMMGDDVRVQNELITHGDMLRDIRFRHYYMEREKNPNITGEEFMRLTDSTLAEAMNRIEKTLAEHPTLSVRFREFVRTVPRITAGENLSQSIYFNSGIMGSERYRQFVQDSCLAQVPRPYMLYPSVFRIAGDNTDWQLRSVGVVVEDSRERALKHLVRKGKLVPTEEEAFALEHYGKAFSDYIAEASKLQAREQHDSLYAAFLARPVVVTFEELAARADSVEMEEAYVVADFEEVDDFIRSTCGDSVFCDFYDSRYIIRHIESNQEPLHPQLEASVKEVIKNPVALGGVMAENQKYIDLREGDYEKIQKYLKTMEFGSNEHGGQQMLDEIMQPLRGKMVLVDVWGTWCGPCLEALKHSQQLYEALADYDIAFVYLANSSKEEGWKNVIQNYNIVGPNVHHYNLPAGQQQEIEQALGVSSYPAYRLFDREGNLLDVDVDAREVQGLIKLLDSLGAKKEGAL